MPRIRYNFRKMEDANDTTSEDVTVVDVYDIASDIGKECEKIIDQYGADAVTSLMPKVINALELLENLATKNERENTQLHELQFKIGQLENDKLEKAEYRQKFEKELEAIEEQWRNETKELVALVSRLQEENRRLIKIQSPNHRKDVNELGDDEANSDADLFQRLKNTVEKQRDELRIKNKELEEKVSDIDKFKMQMDRLANTSKELRRKHKLMQNQVRTLCDERADFLVQLQDQQRDITGLRQRLGLAQKENEDLIKSDLPTFNNKAVWDLDDPNRPRFTTQELKDILHERNELKAKVSDLEDELETYRPKVKSESLKKLLPLVDRIENACDNLLGSNCNKYFSAIEEDAPVQGPLPYEPDDAPWKKTPESGIRKFFRKLFSEGSSGSSFPKRSLSTLSKMALSSTSEPVAI